MLWNYELDYAFAIGTLHDWKLVLYGTDTAPGTNFHAELGPDTGEGGELFLSSKPDEEENVPGSEHKEKPYLPEDKEMQSVMHNEISRTTTENDALSSGCIALSKKGQDCIGLCLLVIALVFYLPLLFYSDNHKRTAHPLSWGTLI